MADNKQDEVQRLKDRKARGEQLTPEEENKIAEADNAEANKNK